ncbi:MAG: DUF1549 domain-containing protein, partial [Planctomycetales bacterium]|nr:DUF1549 domain-containing protein [Planctomycetales bacterium]
MSLNPPNPHEPDGDSFRELLRPLREVSPPSEEFTSRLRDLLREEHGRLYGAAAAVRLRHAVESTTADPVAADQPIDTLPPPVRRSRWLAGLVAAACLLLAIVLTQRSNEFSWASMVAAIEQSEWVEVVAGSDPQQVNQGWFSGAERVFAVRSGRQAAFIDESTGRRYCKSDKHNVIVGADVTAQPRKDAGGRLVSLLCSLSTKPDVLNLTGDVDYAVRRQKTTRQQDGAVDLDVTLDIGKPPRGTLEVSFVLDPQTKLPRKGSLQGARRTAGVPLAFRYPAGGPVSIYQLGVPDTLPIVAQAPTRSTTRTTPDLTQFSITVEDPAEKLAIRERVERPTAPTPQPTPAPAEPPEQVKAGQPVELPPARSIDAMRDRIDALLREHWESTSVAPVGRTSDQEFVRRVYLDLTGRIPTVREVTSFLQDKSPKRREELIDKLLAHYDHASHLAAVWRSFLIPDAPDVMATGDVVGFEKWLTERFRDNQPYDKLVSELLLAEGRAQQGGPLLFFTAQKLQPEEIARQTSRAFLGVRMDCAQCHDDFFDARWKQRDFWAYAAFFSRMSNPEGLVERVSPVMRIRDIPRGDVKLPETDEVVPPRFPLTDQSVEENQSASRREILARWLVSPENPHFARATVNRVWSQLFGRGIVDPVDDMREDNPPVAPELLDELTEYFKRSHFDLRRLITTIARTEAYQLSSTAPEDDPALRLNFAQQNVKCFTAEQLYDCIVVATKVDTSARMPGAAAALNRLDNFSRQQFLDKFKSPGGSATQYQAGI